MIVAALAAVAGAGVGAAGPSISAVLVVAIATVLVVPIAVRVTSGTFDVFEPLVLAHAAFFAMYVLRPYGILTGSEPPIFKGYDVARHFDLALVIALVGIIGFQIGYATRWAARVARRLSPDHRLWITSRTILAAIVLAFVGIVLFSLFLAQSGGLSLISNFLAGRSAPQYGLYSESTAYLYAAPQLLWPAALLLFFVANTHRRPWMYAATFLVMMILGVYAAGQGSRLLLLPLLAPPFIYYFLSRDRRPGLLASLVVIYLMFTIGVAYFRESRDTTRKVSRVAQLTLSLTDPMYEYRQLVYVGADNDAFESLSVTLHVVPRELDANPVQFIANTLAKPIPSILWAGKPLAPEEELTKTLYPYERTKIRASSSAGIVGSMYLAGLLPGVFIGMLLIGAVARLPWEYYKANRTAAHAQLLLAASLVYIPILFRGGVGDTLARLFFGILPLLVVVKLCTYRIRSEPAGEHVGQERWRRRWRAS